MKKNKLSNAPSQNTSPVPYRKSYNDTIGSERQNIFASDPDITVTIANNASNIPLNTTQPASGDTLSKSVHLTSGTGRTTDNDYETIDKRRSRSNSYDTKDPGYETIPANKINAEKGHQSPPTDIAAVESFEKSRSSAPAGIYTLS